MKALLSIPALMLAANVNAACIAARPVDVPAIPNGAEANAETMYQAQEAAKDFVQGVEKYLECREGLSVFEHNYYLSRAKDVADSYNLELHKFRSRDEALASS